MFKFKLMEAAKEGDGGGGGDSTPDPAARQEIERRAKDMGWAPRDHWRGAPERWVDAEAFVRRGEEIMPILQANNRKEQVRIQRLEADNLRLQTSLTAATESIEVLTNISSEASLETAKQRRKDLLRQQAQARANNDSDLEVELAEQIADQTAVIREAEKPSSDNEGARNTNTNRRVVKDKTSPTSASSIPNQSPINDPSFIAWNQDNPWFGSDTKKTALATEIGREIRSNPANAHLQGRAFFDKVSEETEAYLGQSANRGRSAESKVEGGGTDGGGGGGGSSSGGGGNSNGSAKSFNDLPADAKAACDRQAQWVVGANRAFKDKASWQKHYTQMYFNS